MERYEGKDVNYQNLNEGYDNVGAYVAPDEFREGFNTALAKENIFRRFATVINLSSAEGKIQAVSSTGTADWVEDGDPIPESADTFTQFLVKSYKLASLVKLNRSFVTDMNFNLEKYLMGDFAKRFGKAEENALLNGNGTTQPTGILTADADVATADSVTISFDEITSLYFSLKMNIATTLCLSCTTIQLCFLELLRIQAAVICGILQITPSSESLYLPLHICLQYQQEQKALYLEIYHTTG